MNSHRRALITGAVLAILAVPAVSVKMQRVEALSSPTIETMAVNTATSTMLATHVTAPAVRSAISMSVPVLTGPNIAGAECDPSEGRHSGIAWRCFLEWLMEFTDA